MLFKSSMLFLAALLGGMMVLIVRSPSQAIFRRLLVFSGGYLFAITVLHLLPELFAMHAASQRTGLYILVGFFLQLLLELLSKGVEHGHMDTHVGKPHKITPMNLLLALCVHAFLDGMILINPTHGHAHGSNGLFLGILLHKIPEAFALATVLNKIFLRKRTVIGYLIIFSLASPLGLWASQAYSQQYTWSYESLIALWAIICGSFLHIATTIFFEASPGHHLSAHKFLASLAGAGLAAVFEFLL